MKGRIEIVFVGTDIISIIGCINSGISASRNVHNSQEGLGNCSNGGLLCGMSIEHSVQPNNDLVSQHDCVHSAL
jgi:hypothetical protein